MQNVSRDCHRRVLPGKRHSGRTLYAKAQSEPYARKENTTAAGLPATQKKAVRARNSIEGSAQNWVLGRARPYFRSEPHGAGLSGRDGKSRFGEEGLRSYLRAGRRESAAL